MFQGKNILIVGAREGGYGASIGRAFVRSGARVLGTSLDPQNPREQSFFEQTGIELLPVPVKFDIDRRDNVFDSLRNVATEIQSCGVTSLDAVIHSVAGGFPRQPSVMKAVGDILKGKQTFNDMATMVKRNVYYVNAGSFSDLALGLSGLTNSDSHLVALTYRGYLPYFISDTKAYLEKLSSRLAREGKRTLVAALPEAWTQSSQFFTGIELAVIYHYLTELRNVEVFSKDVLPLYENMRNELSNLKDFDELLGQISLRLNDQWKSIIQTADVIELNKFVGDLFTQMRSDSSFPILRRAVEIISDFVRESSAVVLVNNVLGSGQYTSGDVRQVHYRDLSGLTPIARAEPRKPHSVKAPKISNWVTYEKPEIVETLNMYGPNFLFIDRVIMEAGEIHEGMLGFARFKVPTPAQNPLLADHFVNMPMFGGHLQMEAVAQFAAFMVLRLLKNRKMIPILTGTAFPDLNTMAPPGEVLTIVGRINMRDKRDLVLEAFIENRYSRTYGTIKGMVLNERLVKKMLTSFNSGESDPE